MPRIIPVTVPDLDLAGVPLRASVWHATSGQRLNRGDRLLEISAGDAIVDVPAPQAGVLGKRLVAEDELVEVGQIVATIRGIDCS